MGIGTNSVLEPYTTPPVMERRTVQRNGTQYEVVVTASRLSDAPYYLYAVSHNGAVVLRLISNPGQDDIVDAIVRYHDGRGLAKVVVIQPKEITKSVVNVVKLKETK